MQSGWKAAEEEHRAKARETASNLLQSIVRCPLHTASDIERASKMLCQYCSLGMFFSRKAITMACVVLLFCTTQLLHSTSALAASKPALAQDPSVIIAIDETPSSCITTKIVENPKTHKQIYKQQKKCASGTVVGTKTVPASYAKAHHESYVGVLPVHASSSEIQKWSAQVDQLMQQKRPTLKAVTRQAKASCLDAGQQVWEYSGYQNKLDDTVQGEVVYYVTSDCSSVTVDQTYLTVSIVPENNPVWWIGFDYAGTAKVCNQGFSAHELYPNNTYSFTASINQPSGYYGVFKLNTGDLCFWGQGGANADLDVGPLD